jgi:hypothetical protein|nr:MAG TPA: tail tube protein [Caudoviricetes sp.]
MAVLMWDQEGKRLYETGVEKCALYPRDTTGAYPKGVAWNGITTVTESPSGAEATPIYADNNKYLNLFSTEELGLTIEAYTYPDEFAECDGSASIVEGVYAGQQRRTSFGLAYKTLLGNDVAGTDHGYRLHLVYGCTASPSEKGFSTVNDSPEAISFSWSVTTTPVEVTGLKPTALLTIDSTKVEKTKLKALEDVLYGTESGTPRLPLPNEVKTLLQ